jgi:2-polyprenyl-3-methyl-5-hydroxy-6-metoxy-1,4-benzoquinol methylase
MHKGKVVAEKDNFKIIDCETCGFIHLDPIPSKEEIKEYYERQYYQEKIPKLLNPEKEAKELEWSKLWYRDRLLTLNKYVGDEPKRMLDVGCGNGFFLKFMKENGWEVFGIEPSLKASEYARSLDINVFNATLEEFSDNKWFNYFDAINLKNVLEHVSNPIKFLGICRSLLKNSGVICVEVPNDFNNFQLKVHKLGKPQWWLAIPDHINYFDFRNLERVLENLGFEILLRTTDFPMELFLLMGEDYIGNNEVGNKCHQKRMNFELNITDELRRNIYITS